MRRERQRQVTALIAVGMIGAMAGLTAAAVPLYRLFCQVTGYGGTTQVATAQPVDVRNETITVRFNADVDPGLRWSFAPVERELSVRIGESTLAAYRARNDATAPIVGTAVFNVTPHKVGPYFSKIACFCFEEQVLAPGEVVDMPVSFYVDPAILDDPDTRDVSAITLSYTFFPAPDQAEALARAGVGPSS